MFCVLLLVLWTVIKLGNGGAGRLFSTAFNSSYSERAENGLPSTFLITIFSAVLIDPETL